MVLFRSERVESSSTRTGAGQASWGCIENVQARLIRSSSLGSCSQTGTTSDTVDDPTSCIGQPSLW